MLFYKVLPLDILDAKNISKLKIIVLINVQYFLTQQNAECPSLQITVWKTDACILSQNSNTDCWTECITLNDAIQQNSSSVHIDILPVVNLNDYLLGHLEKRDFFISNFPCFQYAVCLLVLTST